MSKSSSGINDKAISEYVYTVIFNMTLKEKSSLPGYLSRQINTEKRAKRFAQKSSTDQKRELLSYLGIGFFWTFVNLKAVTDKQYFSVLKKFKEDYPVASLKEMSEWGMCVTNDLDYAFLLGQMSQVVTSGAYVRNMELMRVGGVLKRWGKKLISTKEAEDIEEDAIRISRFTDNVLSNSKHIESITGVTEYDFRILNYLYQQRNRYHPIEDVWQKFVGDIPQRKLSFSIGKLAKELMVQKHFDYRKKEIAITKLGLQVIHKFNNSVFK
jgi:hypothetical protein